MHTLLWLYRWLNMGAVHFVRPHTICSVYTSVQDKISDLNLCRQEFINLSSFHTGSTLMMPSVDEGNISIEYDKLYKHCSFWYHVDLLVPIHCWYWEGEWGSENPRNNMKMEKYKKTDSWPKHVIFLSCTSLLQDLEVFWQHILSKMLLINSSKFVSFCP